MNVTHTSCVRLGSLSDDLAKTEAILAESSSLEALPWPLSDFWRLMAAPSISYCAHPCGSWGGCWRCPRSDMVQCLYDFAMDRGHERPRRDTCSP